jgi:hypothetical protein
MLGTKIVIWTSAIFIFFIVLNLVRQRKLREEYSWLWLAAAVFYLVMAVKPILIDKLSSFIGITNNITAFIFFSLFFIILILINYSVKLSNLTTKMKDIAQIVAILEADQNEQSRSLQALNIEDTDSHETAVHDSEEKRWQTEPKTN